MRRPRLLSPFLLLWPIAALGVFALLQVWRIGVFDQIQLGTRPDTPRPSPPAVVSQLGPWVLQARNTQAKAGEDALHVLNEVRRIPEQRPFFLIASLGAAFAMAIVGAAASVGLTALASRRARWLPFSLSPGQRLRTAGAAIGMAWPWGLFFGAFVGAVVWYVGFDRVGGSRPLLAGLTPGAAHAVAMVAVWSVLTALASVCFLRRAVVSSGPVPLAAAAICGRCRYSVVDLASGRCPECGSVVEEVVVDAPPSRSCHLRAARRVIATCVVIGAAIGAAYSLSAGARRWLLLRPPGGSWWHVMTLDASGPPVTKASLYGTVSLRAERGSSPDGSWDGSWVISWRFTSADGSGTASDEGSFVTEPQIPAPGKATFGFGEFPFGELCFCTLATDPEHLIVQGPPLIFQRPE